ncbi:MAG: hypothetical protein J7L82_05005 [Staphylothermus sp.]|nr:hypothetical protein [Staphylothermus sp.]
MRGDIVVIGVLVLIIGFVIAFYSYSELQEYNKLGIFGPILQEISEELKQRVEDLKMMLMFGAILCIIGLFTAIAGLVAKPKLKEYKPEYWQRF